MIDLNLGDTQLIIEEARKRKVTDPQLAYILATAKWETNHTMKPVKEAYWLSEEWRKKNLRYYPWYGRGYVQLTWEENYKKAEKKLFTDLTRNPDRAMIPSIAAQVLVVGSMEGWFTGKKLPDYVNNDKADYVGARRVINIQDKAKEIATLAQEYFGALVIKKPEPKKQVGFLEALFAMFRKSK